MHLNDIRDGTSIGKDILEKYKAALEKNDMVSRDDLYKDWLVLKQGRTNPAKSVGFTAWYSSLMSIYIPS
jgi:hypothetical protein